MFTGCGTAMVTPFRKDGSLDETTLRKLVRRQIEQGIDFLVPCGTTGESPTLTREEHLRVVAITVEEAARKVPVLAGAGGYNTREVIELAASARSSAPTASFPSRRITTSRRRKACTSTTEPSRRRSRFRSSFTACRAAPALTLNPPRWCASRKSTTSSASKKPRATSRRLREVIHRVPDDFIVLSGDDAMTCR